MLRTVTERTMKSAEYVAELVRNGIDLKDAQAHGLALEKAMDDYVTRSHLDARLDALEAKLDARFATVDARFQTVDAKFEALEYKMRSTLYQALFVQALAVAGLTVALIRLFK